MKGAGSVLSRCSRAIITVAVASVCVRTSTCNFNASGPPGHGAVVEAGAAVVTVPAVSALPSAPMAASSSPASAPAAPQMSQVAAQNATATASGLSS
eukprot:CAMPEP_0198560108 /NCGR_PEP_ID=MMETSP1462-20131121/93412_1 /TAXON_ID=1333877 /ORGANISM="Brandtodinium nutriculum, Strain RCC3387" /LENGTH=96 /DNA_ID=CAMNT_0044290963 /DNA_START=71 /DNA_END=358 /DNA_ORIENTATION=-